MKFVKDICEMSGKIRSERRLKQIYTIVHRAYLNDIAENGEEVHITEEEYYREGIDRLLDTLVTEKMKGIYLFMLGISGKAV